MRAEIEAVHMGMALRVLERGTSVQVRMFLAVNQGEVENEVVGGNGGDENINDDWMEMDMGGDCVYGGPEDSVC